MSLHPTRRQALAAAIAGASLRGQESPETRQATGIKIGEVTPTSAVVWGRRTLLSRRLDNGIPRRGAEENAHPLDPGTDVNTLEGACAGAEGFLRVSIQADPGRGARHSTQWVEVSQATDFAHQFRLDRLEPATLYRVVVETKAKRGNALEGAVAGRFRTAPSGDAPAPVQFALTTCQMYAHMDRPDGFWIYDSMQRLQPDFLVSCGDNVYYDEDDPIADSVSVAHYHWQRMFSLPTVASCLSNIPGYWQKDDHDTLCDDCWPTINNPKMGSLRFEDGQRIFRQQAPLPEGVLYRNFRWGSALEVWLPESRDYRSANTDPDGPRKSLWGAAQKKWLKASLLKSKAEWKVIINPDPIVGPDKARKSDNQSNRAWATEGREIRFWLRDNLPGRVILLNGDRHWQYYSVDPETGLHEFGCGPASDMHAQRIDLSPRYHKFLRLKGGFLTLRVNPADARNNLVVEHRDVKGQVVNQRAFRKPDPAAPWA